MLPACATLTIVAAISEESVMKQTLSSETPARVRRGQFRAVALGVGVSAMALACSFGEIDNDNPISPPGENLSATEGTTTVEEAPVTNPVTSGGPRTNTTPAAKDPDAAYNPDEDPFTSTLGQEVKAILEANCSRCHSGGTGSGGMNYILDLKQLVTNDKVVPSIKEDSQLYVRMQQQSMPPAYERTQRPTFGQ